MSVQHPRPLRRGAALVLSLAATAGLGLAALPAAQAAGPGAGHGRAQTGLLCPGDTTASAFAISTASRAWSAAQEVGGSRVLVPTSFAVAVYAGDPADPSSYVLQDARAEVLASKGSSDALGSVACVVDGTQSALDEGGFTAIVVNGLLG